MNVQIPKVGRWLKGKYETGYFFYTLKNVNDMAYTICYNRTYHVVYVAQTTLMPSEVECIPRHTVNEIEGLPDVNDFKVSERNKMGDMFIISNSEFGVFLNEKIYAIFSKYLPIGNYEKLTIRIGNNIRPIYNVHIIGKFRERIINGIFSHLGYKALTKDNFNYMVSNWIYLDENDKCAMLRYALQFYS